MCTLKLRLRYMCTLPTSGEYVYLNFAVGALAEGLAKVIEVQRRKWLHLMFARTSLC
jgi:hypothetical protein